MKAHKWSTNGIPIWCRDGEHCTFDKCGYAHFGNALANSTENWADQVIIMRQVPMNYDYWNLRDLRNDSGYEALKEEFLKYFDCISVKRPHEDDSKKDSLAKKTKIEHVEEPKIPNNIMQIQLLNTPSIPIIPSPAPVTPIIPHRMNDLVSKIREIVKLEKEISLIMEASFQSVPLTIEFEKTLDNLRHMASGIRRNLLQELRKNFTKMQNFSANSNI